MSDKKKYKTGFFTKVIGKDILPKSLRDKYQFAYDNPTLGMTEEEYKKRRTKKQNEKMGDIEYKFQKKYSNPPRKPKT